MNSPLAGPGGRYLVAVEALASQDGQHFTRHRTESGFPVGGATAMGEAPGAPPSSYLVVVDEVCSLILQPGQNGLSVRDVRLLNACHIRLTARVTPGLNPPDWLAGEGCYLLFDGDSAAASALPARYIPLDGLTAPDEWTASDRAPLDILAVAVGRSVERANTVLACNPSPAGTALVTSVTLRLGVSRVDLGRNRVLISLAPSHQEAGGQFVELTLTSSVGGAVEEAETAVELSAPDLFRGRDGSSPAGG